LQAVGFRQFPEGGTAHSHLLHLLLAEDATGEEASRNWNLTGLKTADETRDLFYLFVSAPRGFQSLTEFCESSERS
jgi:hypothetical protein